jgi:hypothetical protein
VNGGKAYAVVRLKTIKAKPRRYIGRLSPVGGRMNQNQLLLVITVWPIHLMSLLGLPARGQRPKKQIQLG